MFQFMLVVGLVLAYYGYAVTKNPRIWGNQGRDAIKEENWNRYVRYNGQFAMYAGFLMAALGALDMLCNKFGFVNQKAEQQLCQKQKQKFRIKTNDMSLPANSLSGGNQQKVVLAKWLARDVDVLILDEPTRGIDVGSKEEIYHLITELARQGKAIIMISSELPEVLGMSDRIMVMYEGRVMGELSADEATQERVLAYSFGHADTKQEEGTI